MIALGASGLTRVFCFGGRVVRLGWTLSFVLGFSAGTVSVPGGGERGRGVFTLAATRGRGVFTLAAMVVLAVMGLFDQRRLCLCSLLVGSVCMALRKSRLRLWVLRAVVVGPLGLLPSLWDFVSGIWLCSSSPFRSVVADGPVQMPRSLVVYVGAPGLSAILVCMNIPAVGRGG